MFKATDVDSDKLSFTFSEVEIPNDFPFFLDAESGVLTLVDPGFDYETKQEYTINVTAYDGLFRSYTILALHIEDVNDNTPQFEQVTYYATVDENTEEFSLQLNVS